MRCYYSVFYNLIVFFVTDVYILSINSYDIQLSISIIIIAMYDEDYNYHSILFFQPDPSNLNPSGRSMVDGPTLVTPKTLVDTKQSAGTLVCQ